MLWVCLKLGTAYRLAEGVEITAKLTGIIGALGEAFSSVWPGLNGFDWLIGITGAVVLRLVIYYRLRQKAKYRAMLSQLVDQVSVHEQSDECGIRTQTVQIKYNFVGCISPN